jgi:putative membrane protein
MAQTTPDRFEVRMTSDSHFGWIRTRLSVERTMMSWIRTSVSMIGFGFTIVQFFQHLNAGSGVAPALLPQAPRYLGEALISAGVLTLLVSALQFWREVRYLWSEPFRPLAGRTGKMEPVIEQSPILGITIVIGLIGLFALGAVLRRM